MYSNPPMDYAYHTPSYHSWSTPPTYPTNPSSTSSFPSFPWELFTPCYTYGSSSPSLYPNHGYSPHPSNANPYSSYSFSHYSCYYNNYHHHPQPTKTSNTIKKKFGKHLQVSYFSFKKNSKKNSQTFLTKFNSTNIKLNANSTFPILVATPTPTPIPSSLPPNPVSDSPLYNKNWRIPLPKSQTPSSNSVVYPYTHQLSRIPLQSKSKEIRYQTFASHFKASTTVSRICTDVHLSDDPENVNIAHLLDSRFDCKTTNTDNSLLVPDDEEDFKNNQATYLAVIEDADDVFDEASYIESSQADFFGEIDKAIALKRTKFSIQGLIKPNSAKENIADVIHAELQPYEVDDAEEIEQLKGLAVHSVETPGDLLGSNSDSFSDLYFDSSVKSKKSRIVEPRFQLTLAELLDRSKVVPVSVYGNLEVDISGIPHDSRLAISGDTYAYAAAVVHVMTNISDRRNVKQAYIFLQLLTSISTANTPPPVSIFETQGTPIIRAQIEATKESSRPERPVSIKRSIAQAAALQHKKLTSSVDTQIIGGPAVSSQFIRKQAVSTASSKGRTLQVGDRATFVCDFPSTVSCPQFFPAPRFWSSPIQNSLKPISLASSC